MSNQGNPNNFSMMCRYPLEDAAVIKFRAEAAGLTVNAYMASLIRKHVGGALIDQEMQNWIDAHRAMNLEARAKADKEVAKGKKQHKKRGRPPKAKKRGRPAKRVRKVRSDKGVPRGPRRGGLAIPEK